jgi:hypothetical protein
LPPTSGSTLIVVSIGSFISCYRCGLNEIFALLGRYATNSILLPAFRNKLSVPSSRIKQHKKKDCLTLEDRADKLSRNVGKLPLYAA